MLEKFAWTKMHLIIIVKKTSDSIEETEIYIKYTLDKKNKLITTIITPRFAPACSSKLMHELGKLSKKYNIPIQSHISENKKEVAWVKDLFPKSESYSKVYDDNQLLNEKTVMAHGIYLTDEELHLFKERNAGISHCPVSNTFIHSGILDCRRVLKEGVKLGLGTDISGGCSPSILEVIRFAVACSNTLQMNDEHYHCLSYKEAFALATLGGAQVLGLEKDIGNFEVGKQFDAIIVDPFAYNSPFDVFEQQDKLEDIFQKFIFLGDDRNIVQVFVSGKVVKHI